MSSPFVSKSILPGTHSDRAPLLHPSSFSSRASPEPKPPLVFSGKPKPTMANNAKEEPKTAPHPDRWYNLTLGPSFKDESSSQFCTLRYEFKPASIDKTKPGTLKKTKDNRVTVEFQNNQLGKPNVLFKGNSEDYKDNDAVLFFDGQTFRLERLHRAVKQLRHDRQPGESAGIPLEPQLSPPPAKVAKTTMHPTRTSFPAVPVEVERIDIGMPENSGAKSASKSVADYSFDQPNASAVSPEPKDDEVDEHQDIDINDLFGSGSPEDGNAAAEDKSNAELDTNIPHHNEIDDEIADVDVSGDEVDKGPNAAEALRAQVNAGMSREQTSSSSSSSGSGSGSGSASSSSSSSSSDSDGSDDDSAVNSI